MISYSIMAHPKRAEYALDLMRNLNAPIALDEKKCLWENAKRAWRMHQDLSDAHFVIQDDAILCKNFKERVEALVTQYPGHAYCLYAGKNLKSLKGKFSQTIIHNRIHWGIGLGLPAEHIEPFLKFGDRWTSRYGTKHSDTRLCRYCREVGLKVVYPYPSLIDHRQIPSLIGDSSTRSAYAF